MLTIKIERKRKLDSFFQEENNSKTLKKLLGPPTRKSSFNIEAKPIQRTYTNNEKLAKELHKQIIRNFKKGAVYSRFKDNIWSADLADIQLISKFNKRFRFLLCVIDI